MILAIDGPSGSGKSTVARAVAKRCGLTYLDTGAMYRTVALSVLRQGIDPTDDDRVAEVARTTTVSFEPRENGQGVFLNGDDVTAEIRTPEVELAVSPVSANPQVREIMVALQREAGETGNVVAEGRDIGTVVFPSADLKIFLTASAEARAHRRAVQRRGGDLARDCNAPVDAEEEQRVLAELLRRDAYDSSRATSPLRPADDAVQLDSSDLAFDEVVDRIVSLSPELIARDTTKG